ncbi:MAG: TadE/TadG family type IV pilus assembly protein [Bradyrhizobium sp.]
MSPVTETTKARARVRVAITGFFRDRSGIAATEFAVIVPIMLVMFFGTVEFSSGLAVDRNVSLVARALANLTSQGTQATVPDLTNYFGAGTKIMTPYTSLNMNMTISELYIDPSSGNARVQWSNGSAPRGISSVVAIPSSLIARNPTTNAINPSQYVILSEVNTVYTPTIGYVMVKSGVTLSDVAYAIPRQSTCVFYPSTPAIVPPATTAPCPTL